VLRRPDPRVATVVAAAGCGLAVFGTLALGGDALDGDGGSSGSQIPGVVLCLALLVSGLVLVRNTTSTAFRTAGSFAAVAAIPPLLFFLTFDEGGFPPYSTEAILVLSAAAWIAMHFVGPTRGRIVPLGAGLVAAWLALLQVTEEPFTAPFDLFDATFGGVIVDGGGSFDDDGSFGRFDVPDPTTMGAISLLVGLGLGFVGLRLHRQGQVGRATAFAAATAITLPVAVAFLAVDLEQVGSGLLLVVLGLALTISGAAQSRRFTAWFGGVGVFYGVLLLLEEAIGSDASITAIGLASLVAGAVVVAGAHLLSKGLDEPDEEVDGPSPFPGGGRSSPATTVVEF
jgi:hypothetical protein